MAVFIAGRITCGRGGNWTTDANGNLVPLTITQNVIIDSNGARPMTPEEKEHHDAAMAKHDAAMKQHDIAMARHGEMMRQSEVPTSPDYYAVSHGNVFYIGGLGYYQ